MSCLALLMKMVMTLETNKMEVERKRPRKVVEVDFTQPVKQVRPTQYYVVVNGTITRDRFALIIQANTREEATELIEYEYPLYRIVELHEASKEELRRVLGDNWKAVIRESREN